MPQPSWKLWVVLVLMGLGGLFSVAGMTSQGVWIVLDLVAAVGGIILLWRGSAWVVYALLAFNAIEFLVQLQPVFKFLRVFGTIPDTIKVQLVVTSGVFLVFMRFLWDVREEVKGREAQRIAQTSAATPVRPHAPGATDTAARLHELATLKDQGLISDADFETKKAAIIKEL